MVRTNMELNILKWNLPGGLLMRRLVLRSFMLMLAVIVVSVLQVSREVWVVEPLMSNFDKCPFDLDSNYEFNLTGLMQSAIFGAPKKSICNESEYLEKFVFKELMEKDLLQSSAAALCIGERSASAVLALRHLGFFDTIGIEKHPYFSLLKRRFVYEIEFGDNNFDFVFCEDLDRVSVPTLLLMEIERVLRPGGTGAMLVGARRGLVSSVNSLASFLKSSDVVHVCDVGLYKLVIFKKRLESFASFEHFQLPSVCPAVANNKPFMKNIEALRTAAHGQAEPELSYLPKMMNISSRNKLVYINVGAGEYAQTSIARLSRPYCASHHASFEVFIIDHKISILSSYVTEPGIHFVYHPALSGEVSVPDVNSDEYVSAPVDDEGFDFVPWFKETVSEGDFVILMMQTRMAELNILVELFKTGAICLVDEVFMRCSDGVRDCRKLLESLRKSGVYAHQWV